MKGTKRQHCRQADCAGFVVLLLMGGLAACREAVVVAEKRISGYAICSGYREGLAVVQDLKTHRYGYATGQGVVMIETRFSDAQPFAEGMAAVRESRGRLFGYIDPQGVMVIPPAYQAAASFSEGMAAVVLGGRQGFVDKSGVLRIAARFERAAAFSEGLAQIVEKGQAGFIDTSGTVVIPPSYDRAGSFRQGAAWACSSGKCGYVNRAGQELIPFEFEDAGDFSEGFAPVSQGGKWGYIDQQGKWLVAPAYDEAQPFREELAMVGKKMASQPDRGYGAYTGPAMVYGYIDRRGQMVIEPAILRASSFASGLARVQVPAAAGFCSDCYATSYIRKDGTLLPRFGSGGDFQEGLAVVTAEGVAGRAAFVVDTRGRALLEYEREAVLGGREWPSVAAHMRFGYVGTSGEVVIPHNYASAEAFSEGLGLVSRRDARRSSRLCFVDRRGTVKLEVPAGAWKAEPFSNGLALLSYSAKQARGTRHAYMDTSGGIRIEGDYAEALPFSEGLAAVKTSGEHGVNNWGYINVRGEFAIPAKYSAAAPFIRGLAMVSMIKDSIVTGGLIDQSGQLVVPAFYPEEPPRDVWAVLRTSGRQEMPRELIPVRTREGFAYCRRNGEVAIRDARYVDGGQFSEGLAAVLAGDKPGADAWGFINEAGRLVVPAEFREVRQFSEGMAVARDAAGRFGYLNHRGGWAIAPRHFEEAHDFQGGRALVRLNGFYGYLNAKGDFAIRPQYVRAGAFSEGLAATAVAQ